jgi:MoxR-like ATPase
MNRVRELSAVIEAEVAKVIVGYDDAVRLLLLALVCEGHVLFEGVPGVAKTTLARVVARCLGLPSKRVQFTPDLMPSDIVGTQIYDFQAGRFHLVRGPVFTNLLIADEVNRAPAKTQAALLEAMQERQVSIEGQTMPLPQPFLVVATQNPVEQQGTYPLPEAQLDRFLLKVDVDYPDIETERRILVETTGLEDHVVRPVLNAEKLIAMQTLVRRLPVPEKVLEAIISLVRSARPEQSAHPQVQKRVDWGPSPRAGQSLMLAARSRALLRGRLSPSLDDIEALAEPALGHRMSLAYDPTGQGGTLSSLIQELASKAA